MSWSTRLAGLREYSYAIVNEIPRHKGHKLFIDNWYTGVPLATTLINQGIALVGTVCANRLRNCTMPLEKDMKKEGRGTVAIQTCKSDGVELRAIKWFNNRAVSILTTYEATEAMIQVKRWDRMQKKEVFVECPSAIATYNKSMGGVDLLDGLLSYYRIPVRSKKRYHGLIWHFLDVPVVQGWLLYRRDVGAEKVLSLKEFKVSVAEPLMKQTKRVSAKRGRPSISVEAAHSAKKTKGRAAPIPNKSVRQDGFDHWMEFDDKKGRCRYPGCKGFPKVKCCKCDVRLCFTPTSNCFRKFHE